MNRYKKRSKINLNSLDLLVKSMKQWKRCGGRQAVYMLCRQDRGDPLPVLTSHESQVRPRWKDRVDTKDRKVPQRK